MNFKAVLSVISLSLSCLPANAYKIYSAIVPDVGESHLLVTIHDKPCEASSPNASMRNSVSSTSGCWIQDGNLIKITLADNKDVKLFPYADFKFMGDSKPVVPKKEEPKPSKVNLTCVADSWFGDMTIERNEQGELIKLVVSGDEVRATEQASAINFSYKGMNISLSTVTGAFNYETTGFQSYLNNRLLGKPSVKGAGVCKINSGTRQF